MESGQKSQPAVGRRAGLGAVLAAVLLTSACAAGQLAQTANEKPTLDGTQTDVGHMHLRGLAVEAPVAHPYYPQGADARIALVVVNGGQRSDQLTGISSPAFTSWSAYPSAAQADAVESADDPLAAPTASASSSSSSSASASATPATSTAAAPTGSKTVTVPPGSRVGFGTPEAKGGLLIMKFKRATYPGSAIRITFTFAHAGSKTINVPVRLTAGANQSTIPGPSATGEQG